MWILFAFGSAFFAGITSVLAKCGIKQTDSNLATATRTVVVLVMAFLMTLVVSSLNTISSITAKSWIFLVLSGLSTGASWLCYFKALQNGDINKDVPVDKSSTVIAMLMAFVFLHEKLTWIKALCMAAVAAGTYLMIEKKDVLQKDNKRVWLFYAVLSALFAAATSILGKIGIDGVESNLGTFIRTCVVLVMAWLVVLVTRSGKNIKYVPLKELIFILLSGLATGASWLCYFKALKDGPASVVIPIDKLSILVTVAFSYVFFKEKLTAKAFVGLILITVGTLCMLI
ncbi:MAG: EamA family transporter [Christensenellales bacterium]